MMTHYDKVINAEQRGSYWLAEGNAAEERGNHAKAEKCFEKSQYWLDQYNRLTGNSQKSSMWPGSMPPPEECT